MPINVIAELVQNNNSPFAILDDSNIRGSFRVCANLTERNNIGTDFRKEGMQVYVISTDLVYQLASDLTTWNININLSNSLQNAYNAGATIITQTNNPVTIQGIDNTAIYQINDKYGNPILSITGDGNIDSSDTITGNTFTTNIVTIAISNITNSIIDRTSIISYRAVQYFYTCSNSDATGYETGQIYLVHDNNSVNICSIMSSSIDSPCNISFNAILDTENNMCLTATTDSLPFSRVLHLFKIALS